MDIRGERHYDGIELTIIDGRNIRGRHETTAPRPIVVTTIPQLNGQARPFVHRCDSKGDLGAALHAQHRSKVMESMPETKPAPQQRPGTRAARLGGLNERPSLYTAAVKAPVNGLSVPTASAVGSTLTKSSSMDSKSEVKVSAPPSRSWEGAAFPRYQETFQADLDKDATTDIVFSVHEGEPSPWTILYTGVLTVGGPYRQIGAKWITLTKPPPTAIEASTSVTMPATAAIAAMTGMTADSIASAPNSAIAPLLTSASSAAQAAAAATASSTSVAQPQGERPVSGTERQAMAVASAYAAGADLAGTVDGPQLHVSWQFKSDLVTRTLAPKKLPEFETDADRQNPRPPCDAVSLVSPVGDFNVPTKAAQQKAIANAAAARARAIIADATPTRPPRRSVVTVVVPANDDSMAAGAGGAATTQSSTLTAAAAGQDSSSATVLVEKKLDLATAAGAASTAIGAADGVKPPAAMSNDQTEGQRRLESRVDVLEELIKVTTDETARRFQSLSAKVVNLTEAVETSVHGGRVSSGAPRAPFQLPGHASGAYSPKTQTAAALYAQSQARDPVALGFAGGIPQAPPPSSQQILQQVPPYTQPQQLPGGSSGLTYQQHFERSYQQQEERHNPKVLSYGVPNASGVLAPPQYAFPAAAAAAAGGPASAVAVDASRPATSPAADTTPQGAAPQQTVSFHSKLVTHTTSPVVSAAPPETQFRSVVPLGAEAAKIAAQPAASSGAFVTYDGPPAGLPATAAAVPASSAGVAAAAAAAEAHNAPTPTSMMLSGTDGLLSSGVAPALASICAEPTVLSAEEAKAAAEFKGVPRTIPEPREDDQRSQHIRQLMQARRLKEATPAEAAAEAWAEITDFSVPRPVPTVKLTTVPPQPLLPQERRIIEQEFAAMQQQ